jgi:hypothetical protein
MTQPANPRSPIFAVWSCSQTLGECGLRPSRAFTVCAVCALAMVFSVQQGEHGPLVVYKLAVPQTAAPVLSAPPATPPTVIIGEPESVAADSRSVPDSATVYRIVEELQDSGRMINVQTGSTLTLKQVNDAVVWRRDTAEKLRQVPIAPRF